MIVNLEDLRRLARRRLPRALFDFVDGGAEDEATLRANRLDFQHYTFRPRVLVDVSRRDQSTTVLGERLRSPIIVAPTGLTGALRPRAEIQIAQAAGEHGLGFTLSTMSIPSLEEVAGAAPGPLWFQLYVWRDREITRSLIERARAAGYRALVLTVDVPVLGMRERDLRNGFTIPPRVTVRNLIDTVQRFGWLREAAKNPRISFGNFVGTPGVDHDIVSLAAFTNRQFDPTVTWRDLDWFRSVWGGPIAIKGILSADDARLAVEHGIEAVIVSNHGGRQGDYLPSAIEALPEIVDAVDGRAEVILDGGVRRGTDVVKALALGARACLIGRPFNYAVAAQGRSGVDQAIEILRAEIDRCLALIGRPTLADLDRSAVRLAPSRERVPVPR